MTVTADELDRALQLLRARVCRDPAVANEFASSRAEFFPRTVRRSPDDERLASRRHAEWFLLERPSAVLGGVPVEHVLHGDEPLDEGLDEEALRALLSSSCGVFEVTGVAAGEGVWLRDLAALGEYPLQEPEGSRALERGDLLVGRLFPVGESLHRLSPAAGVFRDPKLTRAMHADFEHARGSRRGVVRLSQGEIERMFWADGTAETGDDAVARAREFFAASGVAPEAVETLLAELAATPFDDSRVVHGGGDALGAILDRLAFETGVDLEQARGVLLAAWPSLRPREPAPQAPAPSEQGDVRSAIAAFDRGRSEGRDLEQLFRELERDLELDDEGDSSADEMLAPDFPGVVGAMVQEFLWDVRRERGDAAAESLASLEKFAEFGAHFGVFENLGARELVWFTSVWVPERAHLHSAGEARELLDALREFCTWAERVHDVPLAEAFEKHVARVRDSLPRIVEANRACEPDAGGEQGALFEWLGGGDGRGLVRDRAGQEHEVRVVAALAAQLRAGDRLRAQRDDGELHVYCCYPAESAALERELA